MQKVKVIQRKRIEKEAKKISEGDVITELMKPALESDPALRDYSPFMEFLMLDGDTILIRDNKIGKTVEVKVRNEDLHCMEDKGSDKCLHVGFAYAIPSVYKIMKDHGKTKPRA